MFWLMAVLSAWVVSAVILLSTPRVVKILRHRGLIEMILAGKTRETPRYHWVR